MSTRVGPMQVLENRQHWPALRQARHLAEQRLYGPLPTLLRAQLCLFRNTLVREGEKREDHPAVKDLQRAERWEQDPPAQILCPVELFEPLACCKSKGQNSHAAVGPTYHGVLGVSLVRKATGARRLPAPALHRRHTLRSGHYMSGDVHLTANLASETSQFLFRPGDNLGNRLSVEQLRQHPRLRATAIDLHCNLWLSW